MRIPALRALESIGQAAVAALPEVSPLLDDPDAFVGLSASYAMAGMTRPDSWSDVLWGCEIDDTFSAPGRSSRRSG